MSSGIILGAIGIYTLGFGLMVFTIYIIYDTILFVKGG